MRFRDYILILLALLPVFSFGQNDTTVLSFEAYMAIVREHHPMAMQANLQLKKGSAQLLNARGGFDPKVFTDFAQKNFKGKEYYGLLNGGVKVPTWFGLELQAGYEQNDGVFLNPEDNTPIAGLWHAGISVPIGQGLFIDQRRAELAQAKIYVQSTEAERQLLFNELLYMAGKAYWNWFMAYSTQQVYREAVALSQQRLDAVKQGVLFGDRPAIDTLEAGIQVQNRQLGLQQAQLDYANTTALISVYLWLEGMIPLEMEEGTVPVAMETLSGSDVNQSLYVQLDTLIANHPMMRQYQYKLDQLEINKRLRQEQLKPMLNLKYNALTEPVNNDPIASYTTNNYTWGVQFAMPIFLRKERGKLQMADLKIQETEFEMVQKNASMMYKANASLNDWSTSRQQVQLYTQTVKDYNGLLNGERQLFNRGESSLFMVNSREVGYINAQIKLIELLAKNQKATLATNYSLGLLEP